MTFDYRAQAYEIATPGHEKHVDAAVNRLHYNESLHMHNLGEEKRQHGACAYCWLRAGRAIRALADANLVTAEQDDGSYAHPNGESETPWHTIRLHRGEHIIDPGLHELVDVTHAASCATLPVGAICWIEREPHRDWWPAAHGTYRIRLTTFISGGTEDGPDFAEGMDVQALDKATGRWSDYADDGAEHDPQTCTECCDDPWSRQAAAEARDGGDDD